MNKKNIEQDHFIGTYARIILGSWRVLARLITLHSLPIREMISNEETSPNLANSLPTLITKTQVEDVLKGPYHAFCRVKMTAYAQITRVRFELHINKDDLFKSRRTTQNRLSLKQLQNISFGDLDNIQQELDDLSEQHHDEWQQLFQLSIAEIIKQLDSTLAKLTETEAKELGDQEPMSELQARFAELNLKPIHDMSKVISFSQYLQLKTQLAIQSSLSRQHLPHSVSNIQHILKSLKKLFNLIERKANELQGQHQESTNYLTKAIQF